MQVVKHQSFIKDCMDSYTAKVAKAVSYEVKRTEESQRSLELFVEARNSWHEVCGSSPKYAVVSLQTYANLCAAVLTPGLSDMVGVKLVPVPIDFSLPLFFSGDYDQALFEGLEALKDGGRGS